MFLKVMYMGKGLGGPVPGWDGEWQGRGGRWGTEGRTAAPPLPACSLPAIPTPVPLCPFLPSFKLHARMHTHTLTHTLR